MRSANTIEMTGDLNRIVALAADIERWPTILPHYRWVTLLDGGGDHKTVEMAARRGRIPVKWRAIQVIERDDDPPIIWFTHIGGVTKGMEVAWTFECKPGAVAVRIDHEFAPPWPIVGNTVANHVIGPHFVEAIASKTLATIKTIVEDRDPRFDPDGRPRS
ncbi:MAG TPA: SRPBCC family protein [Thermomicrobiales bacterium]|nr:SRPBCC family protein [Thermomicrobiales bacterium]